MLNQLLETKPVTPRKTRGTLLSVALHVLMIGAAIQLTQRTVVALESPVQVDVRRIPLEPRPDQPHQRRTPQPEATMRPVFGHQVLTAPIDIPIEIPAPDLSASPTDPADWLARGAPGGRAHGDSTVTAPIGGNQPMVIDEVDKPAATLPGSASPAYPELLKASGVEGSVLAQFVVDTLGRVEPGSFKVLSSTHDAFGTAVRATLPRMRFLAAEAGGRKVRMLVQQDFAFALNR